MSVLLHIYRGKGPGHSASPYCTKVLYALRYKKVPFQTKLCAGAPRWVESGALPAAEIGDERLWDSSRILKAVEKLAAGAPRLYPEDPAALSETLLLEDWADEFFTIHLVRKRWTTKEGLRVFTDNYFRKAPWAIRKVLIPLVGRQVSKSLAWRTETNEESLKEGLYVLECRLMKSPFLVGGAPTAADFAVLPALEMIEDEDPRLGELIRASRRVREWMGRMQGLIPAVTPTE